MRLAPGQVWYADLDPAEGREQARTRPVLIVSSDLHLRLTAEALATVIPLTTRERPGWRQRVRIGSGAQECWAITEQIRTLSTARLLNPHPAWIVSEPEFRDVMYAVSRMIA
ncbi:mRNA interferase MazF [Catenuloplanes nepalensis]|uniref:mRNA interferase MazF n=1 Tax=Catenuloplanes nepalensis TaxID=587533 RepID=A0ABT9MUZ6_9ACTN|nr:type II toxin-antitoxin system PemK/MazF family toxin [Catenuloplanes nepalensis]MDP9795264.1 mRNA interferase MazF [Catenuloplanes nepalensis]